jgi:hypothetical protein
MENDKDLEPITVRMPVAKKVTGLGETKIRELITAGIIKSKTIGRTRLIVYASLKALVA